MTVAAAKKKKAKKAKEKPDKAEVKADKKPPPLKTLEILERLEVRYPEPEWVLLKEVRDATGWSGSRTADAVALSTYPSRGCDLIGFEVKANRKDVLRELRSPDKSVPVQRYCNRWYLVVGRSDMVTEDEVPRKWGLIVPHGTGLRIKKEAPRLKAKAWPRDFVASLVRNAFRLAPENAVLQKARNEAYEQGREQSAWDGKEARRVLAELKSVLYKFEQSAGIKIDRWWDDERAAEKGQQVKAALAMDISIHRRQVKRGAEWLEKAAETLRDALKVTEFGGAEDEALGRALKEAGVNDGGGK